MTITVEEREAAHEFVQAFIDGSGDAGLFARLADKYIAEVERLQAENERLEVPHRVVKDLKHAVDTYVARIAELVKEVQSGDAEISRLKEDDYLWRREVWLLHAGVYHGATTLPLYGDDGELQCSACGIDFKRVPLADILKRLYAFRLSTVSGLTGGKAK